MPTNLPPEYYKIEAEFRAETSPEEKAALLEEMLRVIPKHKGTDHLRADLRRKLAKLKEDAQTSRGGGRQSSAFHVEREGAGQVAVVGTVNVGKSALVAALTHARPEVADYAYTTWTPTPGMMQVDNVHIQLIDTPALSREHVEPELFNLIRWVDLIALVIDLQDDLLGQLDDGVAILEEHRILPEHRKERLAGQEERRWAFKPLLVVVNKWDDESLDGDWQAVIELEGESWPLIAVSAATGRNLDQLRRAVFDRLRIMRVYAKPPGKDPDWAAPFVLKQGGTVEDFAAKVHRDFLEHLKWARVWGQGVHDGQLVGRDHVLHDGDVVELRMG
jgi:hypothetical protein